MDAHNAGTLAHSILNPRSVAVVGASDNPTKTTARPQKFLTRAGFRGAMYFINPLRDTVQGEKAWPSLSALPETPEHVYIMTGAENAIEVVHECSRLGVPVATVLTSGFAEEGPAGLEREDRLRAAAAAGGVRLIGPSSLGVVNPRNGLLLTGNAAFGEPDVPQGGIFVASQSGSVIGALVSRARGRGIGFAGLVSVGGEADLSVGAICHSVLDDRDVTSYALFLESLRHAGEMAAFAHAAHAAGKPVAVYKLGRSEAASELSVSHTGALAGTDLESEAFFRACGFTRVNNFEGLLEAPSLLHQIPASTRACAPRIGIVTTTGGGAAIVVDQLAIRGMVVAGPSIELLQRMEKAGISIPQSLIVDLGLAGARHDVVTGALQLMQESGEFDLILFTVGSSARLNPELAVQAIAAQGGQIIPLVAFALPEAPEAAELLNRAGVSMFRTPESCADAIAGAFLRRPPTIGAIGAVRPEPRSRVLNEYDSSRILADVGVPTAKSVVINLNDLGGSWKFPFSYPVVVKVLNDQVPHKSDAGGVILGAINDDEVRAAAATIKSNVERYDPSVKVETILVQQLVQGGLAEALLGYRVSPDVGPIVVLSTGGLLAEVFNDSSVRLAPVDKQTAMEMIGEVKGLALITGYRNGYLGDLDALAEAIVSISSLAVIRPEVAEAEANPLQVGVAGCGVIALDALVRTTALASRSHKACL